MTVEQAETILLQTEVRVALRQRFAFDTGTLLRLDNNAIINVFDDGRYYIQGDNTTALIAIFARVELAWDPDSWAGEIPKTALAGMFPLPTRLKRPNS